MITKEVSYTDLNGEKQTEVLYFHLSRPEIVRLQSSRSEGYDTYLKNILKEGKKKEIVSFLENLILNSYGEKSADGKRFVKSDEIRNNFEQSLAYDELFTELLSDKTGAEASSFVNGLLAGTN